MKVTKAVIPAAGFGTRFLPLTKAQPKEMLPILDKPVIQYVVEEAVLSGIKDILIVTGRGKRAIEDHFDRSIELEEFLKKNNKLDLLEKLNLGFDGVNIQYVRQSEPRGLGHAILCAKKFVNNDPFAVLLGDDIVKMSKPCTSYLMEKFEKFKTPIIGSYRIPEDKIERHGILATEKLSDNVHLIKDLIEKPALKDAPSNLAIIGRYILVPEIFEFLEKATPGKGGEIQLTDALRAFNLQWKMHAVELSGTRYDVGDLKNWLLANIDMAKERNLL